MAKEKAAGKKRASFAGLLLLVFVVASAVIWGCPGEVVRGEGGAQPLSPGPFGDAFERFRERFGLPEDPRVDILAEVNADNRREILDLAVSEVTFVRVSEGRTLVPVALGGGQAAAYREYIDALIEPGDIAYKITWYLGDSVFANIGFATSGSQAKSEPILGTLAHRVERPSDRVALAYADRFVLSSIVPVSLGASHQSTLRASDSITVYNILGVDVVSATLAIGTLGQAFIDEFREGVKRPLWTLTKGPTDKAVSSRGRCLDAQTMVTWTSHLVNLKALSSSGVEFGASRGMVLHEGQERLRVRRCRS